jgi:acyl carrier protein
MRTSDEIYARVAKVLVHALGVEEVQINPRATLRGDLGAESIDFLDIMFRLEREFGIKIERSELFPDAISPNDPAFFCEGQLTDQGLTALRLRLPYADFRDLELDRRMSRVDDLFTVELLLYYITWKLTGNGRADGVRHAPAAEDVAESPLRAVLTTEI